MGKPSDTLQWATDAGATNDPGATRRATGFINGKKAPAKWFNYLHNNAGKWFTYLSNLHGEAEFLNKAYAWVGVHTFTSFALAEPAEITYQPLARTRTIILPQGLACPRMGGAIKLLGAGVATPFGWMWESAGTELIYTFRLPHGATLQRVRVGVGASVGADATVHCYQLEAAVDTDYVAGITTLHDLGSTTTAITDASQLVTHTVPTPLATDGRYHTYAIDVTLMAVASVCALVEVQFSDPGPRNY